VRRAQAPWVGRWCAPSGFCDHHEHPITTAERETFEETGIAVEVTAYLGTWLSYYDEDDERGSSDLDEQSIAVAYYHARPRGGDAGTPDAAEVAEVRWFDWDALPAELAPPATFPRVLTAWRAACAQGETVRPLRDRPTG
jgi:ADP-ribose pyrophosphatase YjhB (NUDIX family)